MSDIVIRAESLGKEYTIGHQSENGRYKALRDVLMQNAGTLLRKTRDLIQGKPVVQGDSQEQIWALKDVSFEVRRGEAVGIIGRNGAGKSTLLKILSRITEPSAGRVSIKGRVASLLEVGTGFHPELTGRENIFLNGAILGMHKTEIKKKFDEIVAFAEVEKFLDTPVKRYSSGMYVRLAFAVAAHIEPEILIVDEVLAVGDVQFQKKCLGKMGEVANQGRTVLFVSHNMSAIQELCRSAVLLKEGRISSIGDDVGSIIKTYVTGDDQNPQRSEWINPGNLLENPWFKPLSFSIVDQAGKLLEMPVANDSAMWVKIQGEIERLDPAMNVGYAMFTEGGHLLYWTLTTDGPESAWPQYQKGLYTLRSKIPSRFLNEGTYRLELMSSLHYRAWLSQPCVNAPSILLGIMGRLSDSPYWMERRPGILAPEFSWSSDADRVEG